MLPQINKKKEINCKHFGNSHHGLSMVSCCGLWLRIFFYLSFSSLLDIYSLYTSFFFSRKTFIDKHLNLPFIHHCSLKFFQNFSLFLLFLFFSPNFSFLTQIFILLLSTHPFNSIYLLSPLSSILTSNFLLVSHIHLSYISLPLNPLHSSIFLHFMHHFLHC